MSCGFVGSLKKNFKITPAALLSAGLRSKAASAAAKQAHVLQRRCTNVVFAVVSWKRKWNPKLPARSPGRRCTSNIRHCRGNELLLLSRKDFFFLFFFLNAEIDLKLRREAAAEEKSCKVALLFTCKQIRFNIFLLSSLVDCRRCVLNSSSGLKSGGGGGSCLGTAVDQCEREAAAWPMREFAQAPRDLNLITPGGNSGSHLYPTSNLASHSLSFPFSSHPHRHYRDSCRAFEC